MYEKILELQNQGTSLVLVTVISAKGSVPRPSGTKMLVTSEAFFGTIGGGNLEWIALQKARELIRTQGACEKLVIPLSSKAQQCCGGSMELFFEVIFPKPEVLIFGAGHVTQALLEVLKGTDFACQVVDQRQEWIELAVTSQAHCQEPLKWINENSQWPESRFILVMTHDHLLDEKIIENLLDKPCLFLGLIGSKTKKQRFEQRLLIREVDPRLWAKLHCPVGLGIGGKSPKEVAISIAAQMIQIWNERKKEYENQFSPALGGVVLEDGPR